ncbi:MAG: hypothetical protein ABSE35_11900 [Bryobacteraceae bacterium]
MILRKLSLFAAVLRRHVTGRRARRVGFILLLALVGLSTGVRIRSYLLTRRIQAVLAGLQQLKVDATKEEDLSRTVPYLVREPFERREGTHLIRFYGAVLSNGDDHYHWQRWVPKFVLELWPSKRWEGGAQDKWSAMDVSLKAAYILGWRYLSFSAFVTVLDGRVSKISYGIEPDVFMGWPKSYLVTANSTHGFRMAHHLLVPVSSADDESPFYRFGAIAGQFSWFHGEDAAIGVVYTPDAPREKVSHVYQVDLSCFWSLRGCNSVRQVVPLLWKDRQEILTATAVRLTSNDPCPDRVLAGRVRTLPDLNIALLEVVHARSVDANTEGDLPSEIVVDYRLKEVILGHPEGPWTGMRTKRVVQGPLSPTGQIANGAPRAFPRAGERFLYFSGAKSDSCRIVPATPSAEAAVRGAAPADRWIEDEVAMGGRM